MEGTLTLNARPAESYSRLNFVLRFFGLYYIFYIAHLVLLAGYTIAAMVVTMLNLVLAFITGSSQKGLTSFVEGWMRWQCRVNLSIMGLTEDIPHVDIMKARPESPIQLDCPAGELTKGDCILRLAGVTWLLLTPHLIVLYVLNIALSFAWVVGFLIVLFTGKWHTGIFDFIVGYLRWQYRVIAYATGLSTTYPPFSLK